MILCPNRPPESERVCSGICSWQQPQREIVALYMILLGMTPISCVWRSSIGLMMRCNCNSASDHSAFVCKGSCPKKSWRVCACLATRWRAFSIQGLFRSKNSSTTERGVPIGADILNVPFLSSRMDRREVWRYVIRTSIINS